MAIPIVNLQFLNHTDVFTSVLLTGNDVFMSFSSGPVLRNAYLYAVIGDLNDDGQLHNFPDGPSRDDG